MSKTTRSSRGSQRVSLSDILKRLKLCGWYWGDLSSQQANDMLKRAQNGSFILRDSMDACHLFTLSLKSNNVVVSVRVNFSRGQFKLDSCNQDDCPSFHSVVDLIDYYLVDQSRTFYVKVPEFEEFPVSLLHPVWKEAPTLQHLCRMSIVKSCQSADIDRLPLPPHLIRYLQEFAPTVQYSDTSDNQNCTLST